MTGRDDAATFGANLRAAHEGCGSPSFRKLERIAWQWLGEGALTNQTISNYHAGKVSPEKADLSLVRLLAGLYGVDVRALSPTIAERMERHDRLREVQILGSGCFREVAA